MEEEEQQVVKLIVIGESSVGKSSMIVRYAAGAWDQALGSTIGIEMYCKNTVIKGKGVKIQIWDTAGQENFRSLTRNFYRRADGVVLAYDCSARSTFDSVGGWMEQIRQHARSDVAIILTANKVDLVETRQVSRDEGLKFASIHDIEYFETSAKQGSNVQAAFEGITEQIIAKETKMVVDTTRSMLKSQIYESMKKQENNQNCC